MSRTQQCGPNRWSNTTIWSIVVLAIFGNRLHWEAAEADREPTRGPIEEIVVTAEKRSENLQDVSQAITALTEDLIAKTDIGGFVDIETLAPGVTISKNEGFKKVITIRGIGNEANQNSIANPSVSYHLDGIYVASPFALNTDFLDLERIELLRGPQGTLFGQNSTGGAINVVTASPEVGQFVGNADVTIGNYESRRIRGSLNLPLGESLAARISAYANERAGYSENVSLNQELDDAAGRSGRVRVLYDGGSHLTVDLSAQYFGEEINGYAQKGLLDTTKNSRKLAQDFPSKYELESQLYSVIVNRNTGWGFIKSLTSYQRDVIYVARDNDRTDLREIPPFSILPAAVEPEKNWLDTFTQEFQLVSESSRARQLEWVAGLFFLDTSVEFEFFEKIDFGFDGEFDEVTVDQVRRFEAGDYGFISNSKPTRNSLSVYFQATVPRSDQFRLILGARHTQDRVRSTVNNFYGRSGVEDLRFESTKLTGRIGIELDLNPEAMFYSSISRGFKPGGSNLTFGREDEIAPIVVLPTYEEEVVDTLEFGLKMDVAAGRVRTNMAAFHSDYRNLQYHATDPEVFEGGVGNLPESTIRGFEIEAFISLGNSWSLSTRGAFIDSEITASHLALDNVDSDEITNRLVAGGESLFSPAVQQARASTIKDVQGNQLAKTPRTTFDLILSRDIRFSQAAWLETTVHVIHRGAFKHRIFNNPRTDGVPSYRRLNVYFTLFPLNGWWQATLRIKNVLDEVGINSQFTDVFGVGATSYEFIPPRTISLEIGAQF